MAHAAGPTSGLGQEGRQKVNASGKTTEVELKLSAPDAAALDALPGALESLGLAVKDTGAKAMRDRYLDTEDWRLYRAGFGCRLRTSAEGATLTVKALTDIEGGWAERLEFEERLPAADVALPGPMPEGEIARQFAPALAGRPLRPVVELAKRQQAYDASCDGLFVKATADWVEVQGGAGAFGEAELELADGDKDRFAALAKKARKRLGLKPSDKDKYARALEAAGVALPQRDVDANFGPEDRFADAAYRVMRLHLGRLLWHEPGTRLGMDPEHLHDMRVASRRLLAALWVFRRALPERRAGAFQRELKWIARTLGQVRDLDIAIERLGEEGKALPEVDCQALDAYAGHLAKQRDAARRRMLAALDSKRFARFADSFGKFLEAGPPKQPTAPDAATPVGEAAPRGILSCLKKVRKEGGALSPDSPDEALHKFRRRCKRMRYLAEFFAVLYGKPAREFAQRVVAMQDALGEHQDAVASNQVLEEFIGKRPRPRWATERLYVALGQIIAHRAAFAKKQRAAFFKAWKRFDSKKLRKRLEKKMG